MTEKNLFTSLPYLIFVSLIAFAIWYFGSAEYIASQTTQIQEWGLIGFAGLIFILLLAVRNTIYVIPFMLNMLFLISQTEWNLDVIPLSIYIMPSAIILGIIGHVILYKINPFKGQFFLGIALLSIAILVSTILNTETYDMTTLIIVLAVLLMLVVYGFFANTIKGDHLLYLIRIFVVMGVMISFEVAVFYLRQDDILESLRVKDLDLGWGISNFIATYLIMFVSVTFYFIKKFKLHIVWIVLALFEIAMLLFTLSRAGIIAFAITTLFLFVYMFVHYPHKWNLLLNLFIGVTIVSAVAYYFRDYFIMIWDRLELYGLDDNGRIVLWEEAWATFKENLWFGGGILARQTAVGVNELRMFHNTILHTLACFGILGGVALLVQFLSILRIFFYKLTGEKAILLIALAGANMQGMVDNIYFMPQYMIIMFVIIAFVENANSIDRLRKELRIAE
ncbi:MAG: O-antigen ligase family protein [Bacilli bacterium]|nr:O-antigen ligase family protein [Bacilli bacterium]MBN2877140.1 O-antigen ligase family protein [Bacilli bacterium]